MDHLPYPENAEFPPLEIPYICEESLDDDRATSNLFDVCPSFAEFSKDQACAIRYWQECDPDHAAREAQSIVYFGLLSDILGPSFDRNDFIKRSDHSAEQVVTLPKLQLDKLRGSSKGTTIEKIIDSSFAAIFHAGHIREKSPLAKRISLSIEILALSVVSIVDPRRDLKTRVSRVGFYSKDGPLEERMLAAGWCPYWTKIFCETHSAVLIHYLTGMNANRHSGHDTCSELECKGHNVELKEGKYVSQHTNPACRCGFKGPNTKEIESIIGKGGVPLVKLTESLDGNIDVDIVEAGFGKPFIAISHVWSGGLGNPHANSIPKCQLKFIYQGAKRCQQKQYGKGIWKTVHEMSVLAKHKKYHTTVPLELSEEENEIMKREPLEPYLETFDRWAMQGTNEDLKDVYIWFDTFCIPVAKNESRRKKREWMKRKRVTKRRRVLDKRIEFQKKGQESRKRQCARKRWEMRNGEEMRLNALKMKAINKMAFVYAAAMHVLVIEQTVRALSYRQTGDLELAMLLLTCPWMSRCWTFQEACLARQFSFLLSDEVVDPRKWMTNFPTDRSPRYFERVLKRQCLEFINAMPDVMNWAANPVNDEKQSMLVSVWNPLSHRSTTQRDDLHGLLAIMLSLSALEVLQLRKDRRMLAILRSQDKLPLSMLFFPYPDSAPLIRGYEWVPSYPAGTLTEYFGTMGWNRSGNGLKFVPFETRSILFKIELDGELIENSFNIALNLDTKSSIIQVEFLPRTDTAWSRHRNSTLCLVLSGYNGVVPTWAFRGVGACFLLKSGKSLQQKELHLAFICPLEYRFKEHSSLEESASEESSTHHSKLPVMIAHPADPNAVCLLRCGKLNISYYLPVSPSADPIIWPKLQYSRPKARKLQKSLSKPASFLAGAFWCMYTATVFSSPKTHDWSYSFYTSIERSFTRIFPSWIMKFNIPVNLLYYAFRYPRIAFPFLLIFTRMTTFLMIEYPRLEFIAQRIRYERYAESFDFVHTSLLSKPQRRFGKELLYQYQPLWRLGIPAGIVAANFVAGTWPGLRRWIIYIPYSPNIHWQVLFVVAKGIVGETVLRVVWELVWRWLGMDTS
jgi:hypothetical protein